LRDIEVDEGSSPLHGQIALTAPELFGRLKVVPLVDEFLRINQSVRIRVLLLNRLMDLVGEGMDLAIRVALLPDSALNAVKVGEVGTFVCGSPDYLARRGHPSTPRDLEHHECIGLRPGADGEAWTFATPGQGRGVKSTRVRARLSVNNAAAAIDVARSGFGLVRVQSYQVREDLASGRLVRVMPEYEPPPAPLSLLFHPHAAARAPVRALIEFAAPRLRRALSGD
jgi:DNA-binding transcriptional LysR family regulator